ncbi:MAG: tRNA (N6-isopentenyl adenosine(37)-C2)-methylthiotransferase MiaB [Succinivibrio sp.]|nr:tRNA (N6-isopentenyl adenosine(37)-C2)-methylthiotransferase MiaB [Succinivibrio sp.]
MLTQTFSPGTLPVQHGSFYLMVWGCQMNVYDSLRLKDLLKKSGYTEVFAPKGASLIVLITCAVRAKAEDKVFNQIAAWRHTGEITQDTIIALGGCVGAELAEKIPEQEKQVQIVFGPRTAHHLPKLVSDYLASHQVQIEVEGSALDKFDCLPEEGMRGPSAFVTIMEGCSNLCSYCIVPYTRGAEESRPVEDILRDCQNHLDHGVLELHLLGQNVNSYRGLDAQGEVCSFANLLYEIAALPKLKRLRFTTSNPMDFSPDLVQAFRDLPVLADHIHVPVQSGSNRILKLMNRRYTAESYLELMQSLREARPLIKLSSDFIVGFPSETEEDFQQTLDLVNKVNFDLSFSFIYSERPGTPASTLPDKVPLDVKQQRIYKLQERLEELASAHGQSFIGTTQEVLVEGLSRKNSQELKGRSSSNRIVVFEGPEQLIGTMCRVRVQEVLAHTLKGELCKES